MRVEQGKCIGCAYCVQACPFGVILLGEFRVTDGSDDRKAVIKCDLCESRLAQGLGPACVAACPVSALWLAEDRGVAKTARVLAAKAVAASAAAR